MSCLACRDFNSIKVRLNQRLSRFTNKNSILFQFHKGTIKPDHHLEISNVHQHFNSIKVRLNLHGRTDGRSGI